MIKKQENGQIVNETQTYLCRHETDKGRYYVCQLSRVYSKYDIQTMYFLDPS